MARSALTRPALHQARHPLHRRVGKHRQRRLEQGDIAGAHGAQKQAGGELAGDAQMLDQFGQLVRFAFRRQRHGRPVAGLAGHGKGTLLLRPGLRHHHGAERIAEAADESSGGRRPAGRGRASIASRISASSPKRSAMRRKLMRAIVAPGLREQRQAGVALADFGQRRGDGARNGLAPGNGDLQRRRAGAGDIDQLGIDRAAANGQARRRRSPADRRPAI